MSDIKSFQDIIGHEQVIAHLQKAALSDKISHAYLFSGESGLGKHAIASLFAEALQCKEHTGDPCGECVSCKKDRSRNHPDIIRITHIKPNSISVDEVREQLINDIQVKPYESRYKIYIMEEAQKMTPQAQNALLKTIEEPPAYAVILLLTENLDAMLPTIRSRCVILNLKTISDRLVDRYLRETLGLPEREAEIKAAFAQGNIGKARKVAEDESFFEMVQNALQLLKHSGKMEVYELVDAIKNMSSEKQNIYDYLDLFLMWFRDVLLFKATREIDNLIFKDEINYIKERAALSSYEGIQNIMEAVQMAGERLRANVNFELTMELLFLTIREN